MTIKSIFTRGFGDALSGIGGIITRGFAPADPNPPVPIDFAKLDLWFEERLLIRFEERGGINGSTVPRDY